MLALSVLSPRLNGKSTQNTTFFRIGTFIFFRPKCTNRQFSSTRTLVRILKLSQFLCGFGHKTISWLKVRKTQAKHFRISRFSIGYLLIFYKEGNQVKASWRTVMKTSAEQQHLPVCGEGDLRLLFRWRKIIRRKVIDVFSSALFEEAIAMFQCEEFLPTCHPTVQPRGTSLKASVFLFCRFLF